MSFQVPLEWQYDPPVCFVVGEKPYGAALATVVGTVAVSFDQLAAGPAESVSGGFPRVFQNLKWAFLVVPDATPPFDALQAHQRIWEWVKRLSPSGEQHELAFVFILPAGASSCYEEDLAVGLIVSECNLVRSGHGIWRRSGSLNDLVDLARRTHPSDLVSLRGRRASDSKHVAVARLRSAARATDPTRGREATMAVLVAFRDQEYLLDLFCRPPSHQNGKRLRTILNAAVTNPVTLEWWVDARSKIAECIALDTTEDR